MIKPMDKIQQSPAAISVPCFAVAIGISARKAWEMVHKRKVPHVKLGRRTLIPFVEIENTISKNTVPALPEMQAKVKQILADSPKSNACPVKATRKRTSFA